METLGAIVVGAIIVTLVLMGIFTALAVVVLLLFRTG
jgi:hypothetical protein